MAYGIKETAVTENSLTKWRKQTCGYCADGMTLYHLPAMATVSDPIPEDDYVHSDGEGGMYPCAAMEEIAAERKMSRGKYDFGNSFLNPFF